MGQRLGQHFLHDALVLKNIQQVIVRFKDKLNLKNAIEVGPGKRALTNYVVSLFERLVLIETDLALQEGYTKFLSSNTHVEIIWQDVLQSSLHVDGGDIYINQHFLGLLESTIVVGNLPYYITSPILRKFFNEINAPVGVFLIQREVGEKLDSEATKKSYLRWLLNFWYTISYEFTVSAESFSPPPKVESCVISLQKNLTPKIDYMDARDRMLLFLEIVSPFKRKTLGKIQKMRTEEFTSANFLLTSDVAKKRLEELSREEMRVIISQGSSTKSLLKE